MRSAWQRTSAHSVEDRRFFSLFFTSTEGKVPRKGQQANGRAKNRFSSTLRAKILSPRITFVETLLYVLVLQHYLMFLS